MRLPGRAGPDRDLGHRSEGPDVVMTVDRSRNQPGRLVGGMFTGTRVRLAGTSIGVAVFTHVASRAGRRRPDPSDGVGPALALPTASTAGGRPTTLARSLSCAH